MSRKSPLAAWLALGLAALLLGACARAPQEPPGLFPQGALPAGWRPADDAAIYARDNLYDLVNGQADAFYAYGFEQVTTQSFQGQGETQVSVQLWQLDAPTNAYGLFTASAAGTPEEIGNAGDGDVGRRLTFWQERYMAQIISRQPMEHGALLAFGRALAAALPQGGEPPALLERLPQTDRTDERPLFFREEISLQSALWLGGENILGLGPDTQGLVARYELGGQQALLLLIAYPQAEQADAARDALRASALDDLVGVESQEHLLAAVFGPIDPAAAERLMAEALP
jgi:hypothetical protein